jgi:type II secretory pathway component PulF
VIDYYHARTSLPRRQNAWIWIIIDIAWMILGTSIIYGIAGTLVANGSKVTGMLSPIGTLMVMISLAILLRNVRRARTMVVVGYLEQAVRLNLPLPAMLRAAERSERGRTRKRLARLRENLEAGASVTLSLRLALPGISPRVLGLAAAGEEVARLPTALARVVRRHQTDGDPTAMRAILLRWYPLVVFLTIAPVFGVVRALVLPKIQRLFDDFHLQIPRSTANMIEWWDILQIPLLIVGVMALVWTCGKMLAEIVPLRRPPFGPFRALTDRVAWMVPVWRGVIESRGMADVCYVMADAIAAGQPADRALFDAREVCTNIVLQNRVSRWSRDVSAGIPLATAARQARIPAVVVGMLDAAKDSAGVRGAFEFLARYYDARFSAAATLIEGAAIPVMACVLGLVVGTLAVGLFAPLVDLINHLAMGWGHR